MIKWSQREIYVWAKETFHDNENRLEALLLHIKEEVEELEASRAALAAGTVSDGWLKHMESEVADIYILLAQFAETMGISIEMAVAEKMAINLKREWHEPDERGVVRHVKDS